MFTGFFAARDIPERTGTRTAANALFRKTADRRPEGPNAQDSAAATSTERRTDVSGACARGNLVQPANRGIRVV